MRSSSKQHMPSQVESNSDTNPQGIDAPAHVAGMRRVSTIIEEPEPGCQADDESSPQIVQSSPLVVQSSPPVVESKESKAEEGGAQETIWNPYRSWRSSYEIPIVPPTYSPSNYSSFDPRVTVADTTGFYHHPNNNFWIDQTASNYYGAGANIFDPSASTVGFHNPFTEGLPVASNSNHCYSMGQEGAQNFRNPLAETGEGVFQEAAQNFFGPLDVDYHLAIQQGSNYTFQCTDGNKAHLSPIYDLRPHEPLAACGCHWCQTYYYPTIEMFNDWIVAHDPHRWCNCPRCLFFRLYPIPTPRDLDPRAVNFSPPQSLTLPSRSTSRDLDPRARVFSPQPPLTLPSSPDKVTRLNNLQLAEEGKFTEMQAFESDFDAVRSPKLMESGAEVGKKEKKGGGFMKWVRDRLRGVEYEEEEEEEGEEEELKERKEEDIW